MQFKLQMMIANNPPVNFGVPHSLLVLLTNDYKEGLMKKKITSASIEKV